MKSCPSCGTPSDTQARFCLECGHAFDEEADPGGADPWSGRMIAGRFRVLGKLGEGGMGEVFVAEQVPMGRKVALKVLRQELSDDPQQVERFKREAQAASQLSHPNTIIVHDFGQDDDGTLFIAMEYLEGRPLDADLGAGPLDPERAARIMAQICGSLEEAHGRHMVHRDLKPENIFLTERGGNRDFVKVLDFGIAKVTQSSSGGKLETITRAGAIFGTPHYMSPEQIRGAELGPRSDVYALGVILYQMLSGHLPFEAATVVEMLTKHLSAAPAPFDRGPDTREHAELARLEAIALRALSKHPDERQPSARAFLEDLMAAMPRLALNTSTGLVPATPVGSPPARAISDIAPGERTGSAGLVVALVALLAAGGGAWYLLNQPGGGSSGGGPDLRPVVLAQGAEGGGEEAEKPAGEAPMGEQPMGEAPAAEKPMGEAPAGEPMAKEPEAAPADPVAPPAMAAPEPTEAEKKADEATEAEAEKEAAEAEKEAAEADTAPDTMSDEEAKKAEAEAEAEAEKAAAEKKTAELQAAAKAAEEAKKQAESKNAESEAKAQAALAAKAQAEAEKAVKAQEAAEAKAMAATAEADKNVALAAAEAAKAKAAEATAAQAVAQAEADRIRAEADRTKLELDALKAEKAAAEAAKAEADAKLKEAKAKKAAAKHKKRVKRSTAKLFIKSNTRGAKVFVDGKLRGRTPMKVFTLSAGSHTIKVEAGGKSKQQKVKVSAGRVTRVILNL